MGKRKLNGTYFHQCDWTGYALKQPYAYMPQWSGDGKLMKRGSYCNWESVVAHAKWLTAQAEMTDHMLEQVRQHVNSVVGCIVEPAPHYDELAHVKGSMTADDFHAACCKNTPLPVVGVVIKPCGTAICEVQITGKPEDYLRDYEGWEAWSKFASTRKKTKSELTVFYNAASKGHYPLNPLASNLFKMQLYGDVLLLNQSREQCFKPRERYTSFTEANFEEQFHKGKRKRAEPSMAPEEYATVKKQMQDSMDHFESQASKTAETPMQTSKVKSVKPTSGLAKKVRIRTAGMGAEMAHQIPPGLVDAAA